MPAYIEQGTTVIFLESAPSEYPTATWGMKLALSLNGTNKLTVDATEGSTGYTFTLTPALTNNCPPGDYQWAMYAIETATSQVAAYKVGVVVVTANLMNSQTPSTAQRVLTALETAMETLAAEPYSTVSFNGQSYTTGQIGFLNKTRTDLQAEVYREKQREMAIRGSAVQPAFQVRFR